jgi:hypothetical protein
MEKYWFIPRVQDYGNQCILAGGRLFLCYMNRIQEADTCKEKLSIQGNNVIDEKR